jgi:hypothetical protein
MSDSNELEVLIEYEGGTLLKGIRVSDGWVRPPYEVHTSEGNTAFDRDNYHIARALAILLETYEDIDLTLDNGVPTRVALDGTPAIAAYLHGAQERPQSEVADIMSVNEKTIIKYLNRINPRRRS